MPKTYVMDTTKSKNAKLVPVPVSDVKLSPKGFWGRYQQANIKRSLPKLFELLEEKGVLDNFRGLSGAKQCERRGFFFTDSDLYKWMEGAAWALATQDDPTVRNQLETAITAILPAQCPDGYLNTYFPDPAKRFTNADLHEMYCAGHYFQAAVAIYRCLNDDRVLKSAVRFADYLYDQFGPGKPRTWACGHPEIELALVELGRTTGDRRYLDFARHILDQLNIDASWKTPWSRDITVPFIKRKELFGHAVRNLYMACGGSDIWAETGDRKIADAVVRLWENLVNEKIYVTGGIGSRHRCEAIGLGYELPNLLAYTETCAAIANVFWNHRNLQITAESRFADWMERSLYNGVISGISLDYTRYFYENPLASLGDRERVEWYDCTCCPSNMVRLIGSITGYFYSTSNEGIWVHLYDSSRADVTMANDTKVKIAQETDYPYDGRVKITLGLEADAKFDLNLRIPEWAEEFSVKINNKPVKSRVQGNRYLAINRTWKNGDTIDLNLPMPVRSIASHPRLQDNFHRVALMRGPLVYCLENVDHPHLPSVLQVAVKSRFSAKIGEAKGLKHIPAISLPGLYIKWDGGLYQATNGKSSKTKSTRLIAVPYFAWANRGKSQMTVWLPMIG